MRLMDGMTPPDTMTNEELRVAVAIEMRWKHEESENSEGSCLKWTPPKGYPWQWNTETYQPPNYPEDLNAAEKLCDRLADEGWTWAAMNFEKGVKFTAFRKLNGIMNGEHYEATAPTLARAICLAFLAVRAATKGDGV